MIARIWHGWTTPGNAEAAHVRASARALLARFDARATHQGVREQRWA